MEGTEMEAEGMIEQALRDDVDEGKEKTEGKAEMGAEGTEGNEGKAEGKKGKVDQERMRELLEEGKKTTQEIADIVGCDPRYVRMKKKEWGIQGKARAGKAHPETAETIDTAQATKAVERAVTQEVIAENIADTEEILRIGKFSINSFKGDAEFYGHPLHDFLSMSVNFWITNHERLDILENEIEQQERMIRILISELDPELQKIEKRKRIEEMMLAQVLNGQKPEREFLLEYLKT